MIISGQSYGRTNQMTGPIDMLLQTVALALAAALVVGYWTASLGSKAAGGGGAVR